MNVRRVLSTVLMMALFSAVAIAQVRTWVSTTGSDSNPCSRTSPCRNFAAAITAVAPGGEVVVLESGGYGAVTVTKAVAIISPPGIHAAVAPTAGNAVTVSAGAGDVVVLRGLYLNAQGAENGVRLISAKALHVENLVIAGFVGGRGIMATSAADLFVKDSVVRKNGSAGIYVQNNSGTAFASLDRVRLEQNFPGVEANVGARVVVRDSVMAKNEVGSYTVGSGSGASASELILENCMISNNNGDGVQVNSFGTVMVSNSVVTGNNQGLVTTNPNALIRVAGSSISANTSGLIIAATTTIASFGNNVLEGNGTDGTFNAGIALQ